MNIGYLSNILKSNIVTNNLSFSGRAIKMPEMPNDSFEYQGHNDKNTVMAKGCLTGDEAFQCYLGSTTAEKFETVCLGDESDLEDVILVFDKDNALPLDEQEIFKNLKDGESVIISSKKDENHNLDYFLTVPSMSASDNATITKKDGKFYVQNAPLAAGRIRTASKSGLSDDIKSNTSLITTIPQRNAEYYYKTNFRKSLLLPKGTKIPLCEMSDLGSLNTIFILPAKEFGHVACFMPSEQKWLNTLKDGEKAIVGRGSDDKPESNAKEIHIPDNVSNNAISGKHLVFENIDGNLYVTDVSRNGTAQASTSDSIDPYSWEKYFMREK